ncbi:MAG: Peptidoglycan glycosyltransferase, partial [Thermomicrobiales bacterium]|nr:Peptidoglycan glycosyltransferase [Thermomicrobiales bacterium]
MTPSPHHPNTRRRIAAALFLLIAGAGLAAQDRITDAQWIGLLWLSWIPLLVAVWPELPATVPPLGRSALRMTMVFLSIMALFAVHLLRVQVVMSDSIAHRVGVDPATGDIVSNPLLANQALTTPRGAIYDRDGVVLAQTVFTDGLAHRVYPEPSSAEVTGYFSPLLYGATGLDGSWEDDLRLTLDTDLQRQAHAALGNRTGAVVLLDVATGATLALASSPSFDPNALVAMTPQEREPAQSTWAALTTDPRAPLVQRATSGLYPPGSTFKAITAAAAMARGVAEPDTIYEDAGQLTIAGHTLVEQNRPNEEQSLWSLTDAF